MKQWIVKEVNTQDIEDLSGRFNISRLVASVIVNRRDVFDDNVLSGAKNLNPFYDPFLMKDMRKCVDRIIKAIQEKEKVTIYGDFDADGVTSTSVLYLYLKSRDIDVDFYIPDRCSEGYGLNLSALERLENNGTKLIITVDTGITATEEIDGAIQKGIDVIVTDHHEPKECIPNCIAVVDPKQTDCNYPFKQLAGVGVAFKIIQAMETLNPNPIDESELTEKYMPLVCLGTIADVVPLLDENREFAKRGMDFLNNSSNAGIQALLEAANYADKKVTSQTIAFTMAPRINAAGRMGSASEGVKMFLSNSKEKALEIAEFLTQQNKARQELEREIFNEAIAIIETTKIDEDDIIVIGKEGWHQGIVGIVASRITERYHKPSLLISVNNGIGKGSGRSIAGINLFDALCECSGILLTFGGHPMAAGFTVDCTKIDELRTILNEYIKRNTTPESFLQQLTIDSILTSDDLVLRSVEQLRKLEPFGAGNPPPLFMLKSAKIHQIDTLSEGRHIKMSINCNGKMLTAIGFGMGNLSDSFRIGNLIDLAGSMEVNLFRGEKTLQMIIKDARRTVEPSYEN